MIIYYSVLFVSFFITAFFLRTFRKVFQDLALNSVALVNELIANNDDDDELIRQIQKSTNKLVVSLLKMFLIIIVALALGSIPVILYCLLENLSYGNLVFTSFYSIISISLGATLPFVMPYRKSNRSEYSELSKLLHRMALDNYNISNKLFKRESKKYQKLGIRTKTKFVIISGLARAGTTSLMTKLSDIPGFVSLSYANMPFLMSPNIWKKFYNPKSGNLKERSHKDGIMIGYDSTEALEEYFFKVKAEDSYITDHSLTNYAVTEEVYNDYLDYQRNIIGNDDGVYLAKNNNFILRYQSIRNHNDEFLMVILYRDPLTHAASLLEKHHDYVKLQKEDLFVLEYMNWLGHHEFGLNQKQFIFDGSELITDDKKDSINYWLKIWINYYNYVLTLNHPNTILVNYDDFCSYPSKIVKKITGHIDFSVDIPEHASFQNKRKTSYEYSEEVYKKAIEIYLKLQMDNKQLN